MKTIGNDIADFCCAASARHYIRTMKGTEQMKTYTIKYNFGQMDSTPREATLVEDARYTVNQIGSIFTIRMDCRFLVINEIKEAA